MFRGLGAAASEYSLYAFLTNVRGMPQFQWKDIIPFDQPY